MKKTFFIVLNMLLCIIANAQDYSFPLNEDGEYEFSEVIETDLSKANLFANATSWAVNFYNENYKSALQLASEADGRIVIKYYDTVLYMKDRKKTQYFDDHFEYLQYTLTIECKEKKYRYTINEIEINPCLDIKQMYRRQKKS